MSKKVKIYAGAVAVGVIVAGGLSVYLFGNDQQNYPIDSPAAITEENPPVEPVAKVESEPVTAPVMPIPETPNGVVERQAQVAKDADDEVKAAPKTVATRPEWRGPTLEDLEKLRSENALLEAQLKNAELKTKIASQGGISAGHGNEVSQTNNPAPIGPRVVMIAGGENNYRANVVMPTGAAISAGVGTLLPGFGVVSAITPNEVIVGRGSARKALPLFGRAADGY